MRLVFLIVFLLASTTSHANSFDKKLEDAACNNNKRADGTCASLFARMTCSGKSKIEYTCKKGLFHEEEKFLIGDQLYCIKDSNDKWWPALTEMPPWLFLSLDNTEDLERTLVIHQDKLSAAIVTKERSFSKSKGYEWTESKYYCKSKRVGE